MTTYNIFIEGQTIPVPPEIGESDDKVKQALAPFYPDAANAMITRTEKEDVITVTVIKKAGTKGSSPLQALEGCAGGQNPVLAIYGEIQRHNEALDPETLLALSERIAKALEAGESDLERQGSSLERMRTIHSIPAPAVVLGF